MQLTAEQCDHYWTKGWLVVEGVVATDAIDRVAELALEIGQIGRAHV